MVLTLHRLKRKMRQNELQINTFNVDERNSCKYSNIFVHKL